MSLVNGCYAVLRYKIAKKTLEDPDGIILSDQSSEDIERWREIVRFNRSGKTVGNQKLKNLLRKTPFIIGPLSDDGVWDKKKKDKNWPKLLQNNWRQLCICDADLADDLNLVLDKVAFIQKTENRRVAQYL